MAEEKIYLYPVYIRIWHLCNAVFFLILVITGISMQFSNPKYPLIRFDVAVSVHNIFGILLTVNYFIFFIGNLISGNGKYYKMAFPGLYARIKTQFKYYTHGLFRHVPAPFPVSSERKFNPLQLVSYVGVMYILVPLIFITGWSMMYPDIFIPVKFLGASGLHLTDLFHIFIGFVLSVFMLIHIYFCTIGKTPLSNFKGMIDGFHEVH
jgi:thiosulfate reductase cytochrome b subunit